MKHCGVTIVGFMVIHSLKQNQKKKIKVIIFFLILNFKLKKNLKFYKNLEGIKIIFPILPYKQNIPNSMPTFPWRAGIVNPNRGQQNIRNSSTTIYVHIYIYNKCLSLLYLFVVLLFCTQLSNTKMGFFFSLRPVTWF
jgi:hypothetical protein